MYQVIDPEEPRSRTLVTPDMEYHQDPQPGFTANGRILTQETVSLSSRGDPVTQATEDTGGPKAFTTRTETGISQVVSLNEPCLAISSERYPINGDQRPPPKEISVEEDASTKNFQKVFTGKEVDEDNADDITTNVGKVPASENSLREGDQPPAVVNVPINEVHQRKDIFTLKMVTEDTGNDQNISTEDDSAKEDQSHSQTGDITTSADQVPVSENSLRKGDKPPQVVNIMTNKAHKRKDIFPRKMVTEDTGNDQNISTEDKSAKEDKSHSQTDDIPTSVDQVPVSENSSRKGDKPPQIVNTPTNKAHKKKDTFPRKILPWLLFLLLFLSLTTLDFGIWDCTSRPGKSTNFVDISAFDVQSHILNVGDLVAIRRIWGNFIYHHYAICTEKGFLMHRTKGMDDWLGLKKAKIKKETIGAVIEQGDHVRIENGTWEGKEPLPIEKIIRRAESQNGEEGFFPFTNNCEHFARDCRYGEEVSREAEKLMFILIGIFIGLLPLLMSHYFKKIPPRVHNNLELTGT